MASRDMVRVRVDIENISTVASHSSQEQAVLRDQLLQQSDLNQRVDQRVGRLVELLENQSNRWQDGQTTQLGPFYRAPLLNRRQRSPAIKAKKKPQDLPQSEGVGVKVVQYSSACRPRCPCSCHEYKKSASPTFFNRVLGQMFIGYTGLPLFSPKCSSQQCQKGQVPRVSLEYWFPLGFFWSQIVSLQAGFSQNLGPHFQLKTLRRVPDSAPCVNFALEGNIDALKDLFVRGLASPQDVSSTRGYSLLRVGESLRFQRDLIKNSRSGLFTASRTKLASFWYTQEQISITGECTSNLLPVCQIDRLIDFPQTHIRK